MHMSIMKIETQEQLASLMTYSPETGEFTDVATGEIAGKVSASGYVMIRHEKQYYAAHRLAWLYMKGEWPKMIDHANQVKHDNRWANLREATPKQNAFNRKGWAKSGLKGVRQMHRKWYAQVTSNGKTVVIGKFATKEEAHAAYVAYTAPVAGEFFCPDVRSSAA